MKTLLLALLFNIFFAYPFSIFSQDGSLDPTYGNAGVVSNPNDGDANANAIQTDGKIVVAGSCYIGSQYHFALSRYNTNGSLDNTFGNNGIVTTIIGNQGSSAKAIKIQTDGKIIAAGYSRLGSQFIFSLTRYNFNGSLDITFGSNGIITTSIGTSSTAFAIDIQADGKILVAGQGKAGTEVIFALCRYNTNGSLDNTFGTGGIVITYIGTYGMACAMDIQADGKIVMAGISTNGGQPFFALTRHNSNGSIDNTFGSGGIVTTSIGAASDATAIAIQADGKIVVAGQAQQHFALSRYNTNGSLDNTFGIGGIVNEASGTSSRFYDIDIQADGKILAAGYSDNGLQYHLALSRYITNGSLDITFGSNGIVITSIGTSSSLATAIAIQTDGKIVVSGCSAGGVGAPEINLVRYNNNLAADISDYSNITSQISICPNPFSNATTLNTNKIFENAIFLVYNPLGEQVRKIDNISGQTFTFYRENLDEGIYFYQLNENNKILSEDKLIITD
jgi:uncharacterized delta-60 repeat protein